jgi:ABC-type glycerol-3-phosphate transport system permease component
MKSPFSWRRSPSREKITPVIVIDRTVRVILWVVMVIYCISLLVLPIWMLMTSFRGILDYNSKPFAWPESWNWNNYADAYKSLSVTVIQGVTKTEYSMLDLAVFSLVWSLAASFIGVATTTVVAYVIAKYKFPGRDFLFNLGIIIMIVPIIGSLPAAMQVRRALGIYDNMFMMLITGPSTAFSGLKFLASLWHFQSDALGLCRSDLHRWRKPPGGFRSRLSSDGVTDLHRPLRAFVPRLLE